MATTPRQRVLARAAELGLEIEDDEEVECIYADAPDGFRFTCTGTHALCTPYRREFASEGMGKPSAWKALLSDIDFGLEPCPTEPDENCLSYHG